MFSPSRNGSGATKMDSTRRNMGHFGCPYAIYSNLVRLVGVFYAVFLASVLGVIDNDLTHTQTFTQPVLAAANLDLHLSLLATPTRKETPWRCSTARDMAVLERNIGFIYRWICASMGPKTSWIILVESSFCLWSDENSLYIRFTHAMVQTLLYPGSANCQYRIWENCSHPYYSATQNMDVAIHAYFVSKPICVFNVFMFHILDPEGVPSSI